MKQDNSMLESTKIALCKGRQIRKTLNQGVPGISPQAGSLSSMSQD